jgi:phosphohistidine phosphatase SixA
MLADAGVTVACRSDAARTGETLAPLAKALGELRIETVGGAPDAHVAGVVQVIEAVPDEAVAVVVGHSNTVGPILAALGANSQPEIGPDEFDRLFILFRGPGGARRLLSLRY